MPRKNSKYQNQKVEAPELPTPEQLSRGVYGEEAIDNKIGGAKRVRRFDGDVLDLLLYNGTLDMNQHAVLEQFRGELYKAGLVFCPRAGFEVAASTGQGQFLGDQMYSRAKRIQKQMKLLDDKLGKAQMRVVVDGLSVDRPVKPKERAAFVQAAEVLDQFYEERVSHGGSKG